MHRDNPIWRPPLGTDNPLSRGGFFATTSLYKVVYLVIQCTCLSPDLELMPMFDKEKLKGYIDPILLRLLEKGPSYGYEMAKFARERTAGSFELKEATLYLSLKRLEQKGWVVSYWSSEESGGGKRKYYKLTEEGRLELAVKKREWMDVRRVLDAFLKEEKE